MKEKETREINSEEKEMRRRAGKELMVALLVFIMAILAEKKEKKRNCWMQKVHLLVKFSKIRVAIYFLYKSIITVINTTF